MKLSDISESVDGLSNALLGRYKAAAGAQASAADKVGDTAKANKRFRGIVRATKKQFANDAKQLAKKSSVDEENTELQDKQDYLERLETLHKMLFDPEIARDKMMTRAVQQRLAQLNKEAEEKGIPVLAEKKK